MSIKRQAIRGALWVFLANAVRQLLFLGLSVVLYRLLTPADFGTIAMASVIIVAVSLFQGLGIGTALIQRREGIERASSTAFWLFPLLGLAMALAGWALAGPVARFFEDPLLRPVIRLMALGFVPASLGQVFAVLLERELRYLRKMWVDLAAAAAFALTALPLALAGRGVWSLAWGFVAQETAWAAAAWLLAGFRPRALFDRRIAGELLGYGKHVLGASALHFLITQADRAVVRKLLGDTPLGYYGESQKWGSQPVFIASMLLGRVSFPAFARLQDRPDDLREAFLRTYFFVSQLIFPCAVGVFCLAPELTAVAFGPQWDPRLMVPLLRLVALFGLVKSIQVPTGSLFQAVGRPQIFYRITLANVILLALSIWPMTVKWGLLGTAWSMLVSLLLVQPTTYHLAARILGLRAWQILLHLRAALLASVVMAGALFGLRALWPGGAASLLAAGVLGGGGIYLLVLLTASRAAWSQLKDIGRTLLASTPGVPPEEPPGL